MADNSINASFRPVEDWLRSLGLICYAQDFYDNGYDDLEICKQIGEDDLKVIDVQNVKDRNDILAGVIRLKQKAVYFELEPEDGLTVEEISPQKLDPFLLLTRVKAEIESEHIQLTQPPYFYPDGSFGDLSSLAKKFSYQLNTYEDDVSRALEQLRRRQLPADSYNDVAEMMQRQREQEVKNRHFNDSDDREEPKDYLNVEVPYRRTMSMSKHDKRVTKSTTNIFEAASNPKPFTKKKAESKYKRKPVAKSQSVYDKQGRRFLGSILKRTSSSGTPAKVDGQSSHISAKDITLGQDELISLMNKVKHGEATQEKVLHQVTEHYRKSMALDISPPLSPDNSRHLSKKEQKKLEKKEKKRLKTIRKKGDQLGNSHFYAKSQTQSDQRCGEPFPILELQEDNVIHLGHSSGSDVSHESLDSRKTPETNILENASSSSISDEKGVSAGHKNQSKIPPPLPIRDDIMTLSKSENQNDNFQGKSMLTSFKIQKPQKLKPVAPPRKSSENHQSSENYPTVGRIIENPNENRVLTDFAQREIETSITSEIKRRSLDAIPLDQEPPSTLDEGNNNSESWSQNQNRGSKTLPIPPPRSLTTKSKSEIQVKENEKNTARPLVPPRKRRSCSSISSDSSTTENSTAQAQSLQETVKAPVKVLQPTLKPKPAVPPRDFSNSHQPVLGGKAVTNAEQFSVGKESSSFQPTVSSNESVPTKSASNNKNTHSKSTMVTGSVENKTSTNSKERTNKVKYFKQRPLKNLVLKKLTIESIDISTHPYSLEDGSWNIPSALVKRYGDELRHSLSDITLVMDDLRSELLNMKNKPHQPCDVSHAHNFKMSDLSVSRVDEWLISIGLPMFIEGFCYVGLESIEDIYFMSKEDVFRTGVYEERHIDMLFQKLDKIKSH
eukprot:gene15484-17062_t